MTPSKLLWDNLLPGVPLVESPFFDIDAPKILSPYELAVARDLNSKGFAVIDFPDPGIISKIDAIKSDLYEKYDWPAWRKGKIDSLRIQDAWKYDSRVRDIATNKLLMKLLSAIYGRSAIPFQTLNFAVGTQQPAHSDHAHFNSIPDRFMCGVWLAFEDVDEENGPLFYYPGSNRWPSYQNEHLGVSHKKITNGFPEYKRYVALWEGLVEASGIKKEIFKAKKGQALIWSSNIVHGGSIQIDKNRTRWSQVTHYFFENCAYTTPVANDTYQGNISYRSITDINTGIKVNNLISGEEIRTELSSEFILKPISDNGEILKKIKLIVSKAETSNYRNAVDIPDEFNPENYIAMHNDLFEAMVDPYEHYVLFGKKEGRSF